MPRHGFTLVELLIVITITAVLAAIAYIALNPAERLAQTRDAQRIAEAQSIAEAIRLYKLDNEGDLLCESDGENGVPGEGGDLDNRLQPYFSELPQDPKYDGGTEYRYYVDNYACCFNTAGESDCSKGGVFVINFESEKYQNEYSNVGDLCPEGYTYGGEAGGGSSAPFDYVIVFTPSCWSE